MGCGAWHRTFLLEFPVSRDPLGPSPCTLALYSIDLLLPPSCPPSGVVCGVRCTRSDHPSGTVGRCSFRRSFWNVRLHVRARVLFSLFFLSLLPFLFPSMAFVYRLIIHSALRHASRPLPCSSPFFWGIPCLYTRALFHVLPLRFPHSVFVWIGCIVVVLSPLWRDGVRVSVFHTRCFTPRFKPRVLRLCFCLPACVRPPRKGRTCVLPQ